MDKEMNNNKIAIFTKAVNFAAFKHRDQRRKNGDIPYINHPIEVANILASSGVTDVQILSAAVLHDTVEDTETTPEEIEKQFGCKIKDIVMECTDNKKLGKVERKKIQISKALSVSSEAKLVKMSDKISNCMDLLIKPPIGWNKDRIDGYIVWNYAVSKNLKGVNENLDKKIDKILIDVGMNPNLNENDVNNKLEEYYQILTSCKK